MTPKEKSIVGAIEAITRSLCETHKCLEALAAINQTADTQKRASSHLSNLQGELQKLTIKLDYLKLP